MNQENDEFPERELLTQIDPAADCVPSHQQIRHLNSVLERIDAEQGSRVPTRRRRYVIQAVLVGAGLLSAGILLPPMLSDAPVPRIGTLSNERETLTVGSTTKDGSLIKVRFQAGDTTLVIAENPDGATAVGEAVNGVLSGWSLLTVDADIAPDDFTVAAGNSPDAGRSGIASTYGQAGSSVTGIDVVTKDGRTVKGTVLNGWFIAAWDGSDFNSREDFGQRYIVHFADGSSAETPYEAVRQMGD